MKFRVFWGRMYYPTPEDKWYLTQNGILCGFKQWEGEVEYYEDAIPMLWTGLVDDDGKDIYEGDVIETPYNDVYDFAHYLIVWDENKAAMYTECLALHHKTDGFKDISKGGYCVGYIGDYTGRVIGNIHENPELLDNNIQEKP